jgi:hypothetical protein
MNETNRMLVPDEVLPSSAESGSVDVCRPRARQDQQPILTEYYITITIKGSSPIKLSREIP